MSSRHNLNGASRRRGPDAPGLSITRHTTSDGTYIAMGGELDLAAAQDADDALRRAERTAGVLILDLRELTFMDAAGLAVVIDAHARIREAGRRFVVRVRGRCVLRLFELARVDRALELVADPELASPQGPGPFRWDVVHDDGSVRVVPVGELDLDSRGQLEPVIDELRRSGLERLILDLRRLTFLDSSGLRLLLVIHAAASEDGFELQLIPGPPHVQRVFELTGTLDALPFVG